MAGRTDEPAGSRVKSNSVRVILGFYSSEQIDAEKAFQTIEASSGGRVHLFRENGAKPHAGAEAHYSALRLEGESLVVAETPLPEVQAIVKQLQGVGLPAVFVLREDLGNLSPAPDAPGAPVVPAGPGIRIAFPSVSTPLATTLPQDGIS